MKIIMHKSSDNLNVHSNELKSFQGTDPACADVSQKHLASPEKMTSHLSGAPINATSCVDLASLEKPAQLVSRCADASQKHLASSSLIHFLTNGTQCYVKIKNIKTGLYLRINQIINADDCTASISGYSANGLYIDQNMMTAIIKEPSVVGNNDGSILLLHPSYIVSQSYITIPTNLNKICDDYVYVAQNNINNTLDCNAVPTELNIIATKDSSMLKIALNRTDDAYFRLSGTLSETYICTCHDELNMFGEKGRYLYMSDDGYVHSNGDQSIESSLWKIEKINAYVPINDIRTDYEKLFLDTIKESRRNLDILFPNIVKYFTFYNIGCGKYLNVSIENEKSYENKLFGDDEKTKFVIRPISNENCVYISYYLNGKFANLYTIPKSDIVYAGAPECNWAKFYIIRRNNYYMFQCFHREADANGNYGKYLCMNTCDNKIDVTSNGCEFDDTSRWDIRNIM